MKTVLNALGPLPELGGVRWAIVDGLTKLGRRHRVQQRPPAGVT